MHTAKKQNISRDIKVISNTKPKNDIKVKSDIKLKNDTKPKNDIKLMNDYQLGALIKYYTFVQRSRNDIENAKVANKVYKNRKLDNNFKELTQHELKPSTTETPKSLCILVFNMLENLGCKIPEKDAKFLEETAIFDMFDVAKRFDEDLLTGILIRKVERRQLFDSLDINEARSNAMLFYDVWNMYC